MEDGSVEVVGRERAADARDLVVWPEHEVIYEQLGAPVEQLGQRLRPVARLEAVGLVDPHPRQLLALACQLVASARQLLLSLEQLPAGGGPLLAFADLMRR